MHAKPSTLFFALALASAAPAFAAGNSQSSPAFDDQEHSVGQHTQAEPVHRVPERVRGAQAPAPVSDAAFDDQEHTAGQHTSLEPEHRVRNVVRSGNPNVRSAFDSDTTVAGTRVPGVLTEMVQQ